MFRAVCCLSFGKPEPVFILSLFLLVRVNTVLLQHIALMIISFLVYHYVSLLSITETVIDISAFVL